MQLVDTRTVREEAECAFEHIHEVEEEINRLNTQLAERTDYESEGYQKVIDRVTYLTEHFQMMAAIIITPTGTYVDRVRFLP